MDRRYEILRNVMFGEKAGNAYELYQYSMIRLEEALEAMDIYATEYGSWIRKEGWEWSMTTKTWFNPSAGMIFGSEDGITDEKLYKIFKSNNNGE